MSVSAIGGIYCLIIQNCWGYQFILTVDISPFVSPDFASPLGMPLEELYKEIAYFKEYFGCFGILLEVNLARVSIEFIG